MNTRFVLQGITFIWDEQKARENPRRHDGITSEQAAEAFSIPFSRSLMPAGTRKLVMPLSVWTRAGIFCLLSTSSWKMTPYASSPRAKRPGRNVTTMKFEQIRKRLDRQRPMTTISMRFPVDVLDDLKRVAPLRGFSGYQPLIRAYVGQGLRADLERLEQDPVTALVESLKRHGVSEEVLQEALAEVVRR
jgi:hypothetical protein